VALQNAPDFKWLTSSGGKSSAAVLTTVIYVLDENGVRDFTFGTYPNLAVSSDPTGLNVNSLSVGKTDSDVYALWLNTTTGLYWFDELDVDVDLVLFEKLDAGHSANVMFSRAVTTDTGGIGLYSGGGSNIGFLYSGGHDFSVAWDTAADYEEIADFLPEITQDVIRSIAINEDNAKGFFYVSTPLGTVIGNAEIEEIDELFNLDGDKWLKVSDGSSINVVSTADARVFAATSTGLYSSLVNVTAVDASLGTPPGPLSLVSGTAGKQFVALESYDIGDDSITAAVTDDNWVYLIQGDTLMESTPSHPNPIPGAAGVPLKAKPVFYEYEGVLHLILSGSNGSIDYQINDPT